MNQYDSDKTIINIRYSFSSLSNFFLFSEQVIGFKRKHSLDMKQVKLQLNLP